MQTLLFVFVFWYHNNIVEKSNFRGHEVSVLTPQYQLLWYTYHSNCVKCPHGVFAIISLYSQHMPHFGHLNQHNDVSDNMLSNQLPKKAKLDIFQTFQLQIEIINNPFYFSLVANTRHQPTKGICWPVFELSGKNTTMYLQPINAIYLKTMPFNSNTATEI